MKTFLMRLTLLAAALPLFATPAQEEPEAASGPAAGNEWFVGSGVPVQYNSPAEYEAATGRTLEYGEAPVLAAMVASGDLPPVGERLPNDPIVIAPRIRSASPNPDPTARKLHLVKAGESPSHGVRPTGCPFHPRCPYREPRCTVEEPELLEAGTENGESHLVACHLHRQLSLRTFAD